MSTTLKAMAGFVVAVLPALVFADAVQIRFESLVTPVRSGTSAVLSWSATNATRCIADGAWRGEQPTSGVWITPPLYYDYRFILICNGPDGSARARVIVEVAGPPSLELRASDTSVAYGGYASLTWSAEGADRCYVGGAWTGSRETAGVERVGPITGDATFSMTCVLMDFATISALSVAVNAAVLNWTQPTQYADGSPLNRLAGFRVYFGTASRRYDTTLEINDPETTDHRIDLGPGTYYIAVTAFDEYGLESRYSNEVIRYIP